MPLPKQPKRITTARAKVAPASEGHPASTSAQAAPQPSGMSNQALRAAQGPDNCVWASLLLVFTSLIAFFAVLVLIIHAGEQKMALGLRSSLGSFGVKLGSGAQTAQLQAQQVINEVQSNIQNADDAAEAANNAASQD